MNPNKDDIFISTCFSNILVDISAEVGGVIYLVTFLQFSKMDSLLPIICIFMSLIPKIGKLRLRVPFF